MERKREKTIFMLFLILIFSSTNVLASSFNIGNFSKSYIFLGLVLLLGFIGIIVEIFSDTFGLGLLLSIFSFSAFFVLNYPTLSGNSYIPHFIVGLILLIIEIVVPGFTIVGIAGMVLLSLSIILTVPNMTYGIIMLLVVLAISIGILVYLIRKGYSSQFIDRLILKETNAPKKENKDKPQYIEKEYLKYEGKKGRVLADMRPSGMIEIEGVKLDAISDGVFIKKGEEIEVEKVEGNKIIVRRV